MRVANKKGACEITSMPGQGQLALCHSFFIQEAHRGKGHGKQLKAQQTRALLGQCYDYAICTVDAKNAAQRTILMEAGWELLDSFPNRKLGTTTEIWGFMVTEQEGGV